MNIITTADWHLTSDPMDEYRWKFLPWLKNLVKNHIPERLNILGDLTEKKDKHSSVLVNRLTEFLLDIAEMVPIYILQGNHDFISEEFPFFKYLSKHPKINYITEFTSVGERKELSYYVPWGVAHHSNSHIVTVYTHTNFLGARFANGVESVEGIDPTIYKNPMARVISGHIHVPQQFKNLWMVGSPYPIDFGDNFQGGVLFQDDWGNLRHISYPSIKKIKHIIDVDKTDWFIKPSPGDQLKLEVLMPPDRFKDWTEIKKTLKEQYEKLGVVIRSITLVPKNIQPSLTKVKKEPVSKDLIHNYGTKHGIPIGWILKGTEMAK